MDISMASYIFGHVFFLLFRSVTIHIAAIILCDLSFLFFTAKSLKPVCRRIHEKRNLILDQLNQKAPWDQTKPAMLEYLQTLSQLSARFPFGDDTRRKVDGIPAKGSVPQNVTVPFTYVDSLKNIVERHTSTNITFEQAGIIFNFAARLSREAVERKPTPNTGLQEACVLFREASGVFEYLSTADSLRSALSLQPDISPAATSFLSKLMLAQAQACFFEKAAGAQSPPNIVATLAAGTASLFAAAGAAINTQPQLKKYLAKAAFAWESHVNFQRSCFMAASNYWWSQHLFKSVFDYGGEIAYLKNALQWGEGAKEFETPLKDTTPSLIANKNKLNEVLKARLAEASQDNDTIYFKPIPSSVTPVEEKVMVKPVPFAPPALAEDTPDEFKSLVPSTVRQAANAAVDKLVREMEAVNNEAAAATNTLRAQLHSVGLPASIDALNSSPTLPDDVWMQVVDFQRKGGRDALVRALELVQKTGADARERLKQVDSTMRGEEATDADMKEQFADRWKRTALEAPGSEFRKKIDGVASILQSAARSDQTLEKELATVDLTLITKSRAELEQGLPRSDAGASIPSAEKLRGLLGELSAIVEARTTLLDKTKSKVDQTVQTAPATLAKLTQTKGPEEAAAALLAPTNEAKAELVQMASRQEKLMEQVLAANEEFTKRPKDDTVAAKERYLQQINNVTSTVQRMARNFEEGQTFYSELISGTIEPLRKDVFDFAFDRERKKTALLDELQKAFAAFSLRTPSSGGAPPIPSRPAGDSASSSSPFSSSFSSSSGPSAPSQVYPVLGQYASSPTMGGGERKLDFNPQQQQQQQQQGIYGNVGGAYNVGAQQGPPPPLPAYGSGYPAPPAQNYGGQHPSQYPSQYPGNYYAYPPPGHGGPGYK